MKTIDDFKETVNKVTYIVTEKRNDTIMTVVEYNNMIDNIKHIVDEFLKSDCGNDDALNKAIISLENIMVCIEKKSFE